MNSSKLIDISKSSLVGLKAELFKKQEEVRRIKELQQDYIKPESRQKKKRESQKSNEGVDKRRLNDVLLENEDTEDLKKSREVLETKSRLYDKLNENNVDSDLKSQYLIDFDLKRNIYQQEEAAENTDEAVKQLSPDEESCYSDANTDPENDWVDFVDTLGRSRRCLRQDLSTMKAKDVNLAKSLRPPSPPPAPEVSPELLSWDMQREAMRKKWEEQETLLLGKKDIHYQDVRFDEARPHGVGYFEFSTDESERLRQQEALKNLRNETVEQQEAALGLRLRRQQQLQVRLAAAQRRRRERLGLPPEEPEPQEAEITTFNKDEQVKEIEKVEDLEETIKRIAPVRPWDVGKQNIRHVMSQEEWLEKKRQERPEEFAPLPTLLDVSEPQALPVGNKSLNFFTSKKTKTKPWHMHCSDIVEEKGNFPVTEDKDKRVVNSDSSLLENINQLECSGPSSKHLKPHVYQTNLGTVEIKTDASSSSRELGHSNPILSHNHNLIVDNVVNQKCPGPPSNRFWKPTLEQIDLLLLRSGKTHNCQTFEDQIQNSYVGNTTSLQNKTEESDFDYTLDDCEMGEKYGNNSFGFGNFYKQTVKDHRDGLSKLKNNEDSKSPTHLMTKENRKHFQNMKPFKKPSDIKILEEESVIMSDQCDRDQLNTSKRKLAEIAPPALMSYFTHDTTQTVQNPRNTVQLEESISVGLSYLKTRTEEKCKKRIKGLLDIV